MLGRRHESNAMGFEDFFRSHEVGSLPDVHGNGLEPKPIALKRNLMGPAFGQLRICERFSLQVGPRIDDIEYLAFDDHFPHPWPLLSQDDCLLFSATHVWNLLAKLAKINVKMWQYW
jgi:hypothetical protein